MDRPPDADFAAHAGGLGIPRPRAGDMGQHSSHPHRLVAGLAGPWHCLSDVGISSLPNIG